MQTEDYLGLTPYHNLVSQLADQIKSSMYITLKFKIYRLIKMQTVITYLIFQITVLNMF